MDKYRFDDSFGLVYEYDKIANAYIMCAGYESIGIDHTMTDAEKTTRTDQYLCERALLIDQALN